MIHTGKITIHLKDEKQNVSYVGSFDDADLLCTYLGIKSEDKTVLILVREIILVEVITMPDI